jgi:hypothetical protein
LGLDDVQGVEVLGVLMGQRVIGERPSPLRRLSRRCRWRQPVQVELDWEVHLRANMPAGGIAPPQELPAPTGGHRLGTCGHGDVEGQPGDGREHALERPRRKAY